MGPHGKHTHMEGLTLIYVNKKLNGIFVYSYTLYKI